MSKTIIRKRSKQKEIDPKFGVSEWDPAELDVRQTRHGTYESRPPPRGGTWRDQIKEEAYKLRQRQREADSPEFISPHSTTDTMDTDEAQEINKQIMEKIEKEPEGSEYLNIVGEGKYENVGETLDTGATFSTVTEMQAEVEKDQQAYEEIESLEDSHIVSFPKLDKEKEALRRKTQGKRVPFETEDLMTSLTKIAEPPPIAFTDPSDFDEVLREGDEYLSKIEEELGNEGRKQVLSRIEKGFAKTVRWEPINFPLQHLMKYHLRLPFPHAPKVLSRNPRMWVSKTPILEHPAVLIAIPEWEIKYGTKSYAVDVKEGYIYAVRNEDWERLVERAYVATDEPLEIEQVTPVEKETLTEEVQTLNSKEKVPLAESTRKDFRDPIQKGRGAPGTDFLNSEPRPRVPEKEIETPKRKLSFEDSTDEEQLAKEIEKDIKDAEQAQWALETERMQIEIERVTLEKERQRIAEERLKALRQQRKKLEESIMKMSNEMSKDINLVTEDRKQRRINMENEYLNQVDLEEAAVDDFFPVLTRVEEIQPDVMTTDSQISSTVDPIEFMDEEALMKLKLKHMRAEQCRTRTHKMYKLFLESATDAKKKENLEHMLLATINNLDRKMSKFKEGLDDYDQKEQHVLRQTERLQNEQEKALQEQRGLQEVLQGLQAKHKVAEDELKALQKEKDDSEKKKKEMEDKINKERKAKIWREQRLEEERQKLKDLERKRKEKGSQKGEEEENKKVREQQDRLMAERLMEKEKRETEIRDRNLAEQLQKKQRLEKDEREKFLTEQLLEKERQEEEELEKKFITSPADVETQRKVKLQDAYITEIDKARFRCLCNEFEDIFSKSSEDIGHTPLVTMDIDTGDSPPVCQKPYSLPLKHVEWVQKELEILERAGVIQRRMSPWASPIVIVPKKTEPGEPPRRRMCVDYRMLNSLLPPVNKAHSKAKGIVTLVPLPKIDEIYAQLQGSKIFSALDMRSGYFHIELSEEAKPKTAFVPGGPHGSKYQFNRCPFGLSQAPAYFQRLVHEVLRGLPFTFGYLDDILIFSSRVEAHLEHLRKVFLRLKEAKLKLKASKCSFFKKHIQYLGHLVSGDGIEPLPEKLEAVENMPPPKTPKEVRQFLGLVGYYRKFVPKFADIARPLTNLTKQDIKFKWTDKCQKTFQLLKDMLLKEPKLKYPDPSKPYTLFTDASKYAWACVLTQEYEHEFDRKIKKILHPITYVSGLFKGSQVNWATLTKEAYAIYMSVKKLPYYLQDADIILRSEHLPLKKFLSKNTLNTKVNNWAVEISPYRIQFEYIKGIKNTLADTMSRLIKIIPEIELEPEPTGQEYGYEVFEELQPIETTTCHVDELKEEIQKKKDPIPEDVQPIIDLTEEQLEDIQMKDKFIKNLVNRIVSGKQPSGKPYYLEDRLLKKYIYDNKQRFEVIVVPPNCAAMLLNLAHDQMGHNGSARTYMLLKRLYYWKGMKTDINVYVKQCKLCQKQNIVPVKYSQGHFSAPMVPMEFISMDLIGDFTILKRK